MGVGDDHQVSAGVGEEIEDDEAGFTAMEDQVFGAVLFFEGKAEGATFVVLVPPDVFRNFLLLIIKRNLISLN